MHRATKGTLGTIGIALILVFSLVIGVGLAYASHPLATSHTIPAAHEQRLAGTTHQSPRPLAGPTTVTVLETNTLKAYSIAPFFVNFTIAATNATIGVGTTWVWVTVKDVTASSKFVVIDLNSTVANGKTSYQASVNVTTLGCGPKCANLPPDAFGFIATAQVWNGTANTTGSAVQTSFIVTILPSGTLIAPGPGIGVGTGNVSISAIYSGQFVASVVATVFSPTNASAIVFQASMLYLNNLPVVATWTVSVPGTYPVSLQITTPYTTVYVNGTVTVSQSGGIVYSNTTTYHNSSLIPGLSPAVGGTILLVVGLIIGMIVALALGRMMWGQPRPSPAQPWTEQKAANQCSVCGKSFNTEEELKDHAKTEHGMG